MCVIETYIVRQIFFLRESEVPFIIFQFNYFINSKDVT